MTSIQGDALRAVFDRFPEAVKLIDREGKILVINPPALRLLEAGSDAEIRGRVLADRVPEPHRAAFRAWQQRAWSGSPEAHEFPLNSMRGAERWVEARAVPFPAATPAEAPALLVVSRDVTERRRRLEQLRRGEERFRTVLHSVGDALIATDELGRVEWLNPVAERLTGWSADPARGRPLEEVFRIVNEETRAPVENPVTRVLREGTVVGLANHTLLLARDGRQIPIADAGAPIRDDAGRLTGVVLVFRDQTAERAAARAVAEARALAEGIVATVREPLLVLDAQLRVVTANRSFYQTFQVTPESTLGRPVYELGNRQWDLPELRRLLEEILPQNSRFNDFEVTHHFERIGWRTMRLNARRLYGEGHRPRLILLAIEDITERKRAEEALRASEERLRRLFENSPVGIYRTTPEGRVEMANPAMVALLGYRSFAELAQVNLEAAGFHPEYPRALFKALMERDGRVRELEGAWTRAEGSTVYVRESAVAIRDTTGRIVAYEGVVEDITERKRVEQALAEQARDWQTTFDASADAIILLDAQQRVKRANKTAERWFGQLGSALPGRACFEAVHGASAPPPFCPFNRVREGGTRETVEFQHGDRWLELTVDPIQGPDGEFAGTVHYFRDITERRRLEAELLQAQKMEAIGRLAGGVAHDFNNILAVLLMQAELLLQPPDLPARVREGLEQMRTATERAANLTRQLLLFSRKQMMQPRDLDLNQVVNGMARMLRRVIGEDLIFELQTASEPLPLRADPGMIEQVLLNLVVNARDAMPRGGRLRVRTGSSELDGATAAALHPEARPGRLVWLRVEDTGCGIPPEIMPHIFEPFFTTKEAGKGTGLGLATVYSVVRQHQGWVTVESQVGRGTTFQVFLPAAQLKAVVPVAAGSPGWAPGGRETILLVEDDRGLRESTRAVLTGRGYTVLVAEDGIQALQLWMEHGRRVALLLTDLVMPGGLNGKELGQMLTRERPDLRVVYMSGYSAEWSGTEVRLAPRERFLSKPCSPDQLLVTIRQCLDT